MVSFERPKKGILTTAATRRGLTVLQLIEETVMECKGSQIAAASFLGVNPNTIRYHLKKAGLRVVVEQQVRFETLTPAPLPQGEG